MVWEFSGSPNKNWFYAQVIFWYVTPIGGFEYFTPTSRVLVEEYKYSCRRA